MKDISPMEIGLMFWAENDVEATLRQLKVFGLRSGQLGVPPGFHCDAKLNDWKNALESHQINLTSIACSYMGEDYSNLESIHKTVGFTAAALRADRITRTKEASDFARALDIQALSCHLGFIPSSPDEALYKELCELTKLLCDYCGDRGQSFVLETGQESAETLLLFIRDVDRKNLKVNFDPANMIMYGSGDPLAALRTLSAHVVSVHCKDARLPDADNNNILGAECALGDGAVNFPKFLQQLKEMNYQSILCIEREEANLEKKSEDIKIGISRLTAWKESLGL